MLTGHPTLPSAATSLNINVKECAPGLVLVNHRFALAPKLKYHVLATLKSISGDTW